MADLNTDIRESVREKYAAAARAAAAEPASSCCGSPADADGVFGGGLYAEGETDGGPPARSARRWAAASRPPSPTCTRARRCSTSARARAPTC